MHYVPYPPSNNLTAYLQKLCSHLDHPHQDVLSMMNPLI